MSEVAVFVMYGVASMFITVTFFINMRAAEKRARYWESVAKKLQSGEPR